MIVIKVRSKSIADRVITKGIEFEGKNHSVKLFLEVKADTICFKCSEFDHNSYKACENQVKYVFCEQNHKIKDYKC